MQDRAKGWQQFAKYVSSAVAGVIEFAKLMPCFRDFDQQEQISLLRQNSFQVIVVALSREFNLDTNHVTLVDTQMPVSHFACSDPAEHQFGLNVIEVVRQLAALRLSLTEAALFSACILMQSAEGYHSFLEKLHDHLRHAMATRLEENNPELFGRLFELADTLAGLQHQHSSMLLQLRSSAPSLVDSFPQLYTELFLAQPQR